MNKPLDPERQQMAEGYLKLAFMDAWRYARRNRDVPADELLSAANYATAYAASLFEDGRAGEFSAYARMVVRHCLNQTVKMWRHRNRLLAFGLKLPSGDWYEVLDTAGKSPIESLAAMEFLARVEAILPPDRWELFKLHIIEGHTFTAIARIRDITRQRVKQKLASSYALLREFGVV